MDLAPFLARFRKGLSKVAPSGKYDSTRRITLQVSDAGVMPVAMSTKKEGTMTTTYVEREEVDAPRDEP